MDLRELSLKDRALISPGRDRADRLHGAQLGRDRAHAGFLLEGKSWQRSMLHWEEIAPFIQTACEKSH